MQKDNRNKLEWHQDSSYYRQNSNGKNGVVLWTPLVNKVTKNLGPLQILYKSHELGPLNTPREKSGKKFSSKKRTIDNKLLKKFNKIIEFKMNLGDVVLINHDMVHRSGNNLSKKFRFSLIGRYHNSLSLDFNPGLNVYKYSDQKIQRDVHGK